MTAWHPISSAPTTGDEILVWTVGDEYHLAVWRESEYSGDGFFNDEGARLEPTHWLPLPAPPQRTFA